MTKLLIILRGVPGSGKSQVALNLDQIFQKKGKKTFRLDLDKFAPLAEQTQFIAYIDQALKADYVIAEMFSGLSHSSEPDQWLTKFREAGFQIHSFVLEVSMEKGYENCSDARHSSYSAPSLSEYKDKWNRFRDKEKLSPFVIRARLQKELSINAQNGDYQAIAGFIRSQVDT